MNAANRTVLGVGSIVLMGLFLFPCWFETNGQYVKQLGHHYLFSKPAGVPVECYLVGCITAPASYFHVVLDRKDMFATLSNVAIVLGVLLLLFKTGADGTSRSIRDPMTRWAFSGLVTLVLPISVTPTVLLGMYGVSVPKIFFSGEDNSLVGSLAFPVVFFVYAGVVYLITTVLAWIMARKKDGLDSVR
jgi:hypothetical protein